MIPLPETEIKKGCYYKLVHRTQHTAIYSMSYSPGGPVAGYDVFQIKTQKPGKNPWGGEFSEKELFPSSEQYGHSAWSFTKQKTAMEKFMELEPNERSLHV